MEDNTGLEILDDSQIMQEPVEMIHPRATAAPKRFSRTANKNRTGTDVTPPGVQGIPRKNFDFTFGYAVRCSASYSRYTVYRMAHKNLSHLLCH